MPSLLHLPNELKSLVTNYLGVRDLYALSKSCHSVYDIAIPAMYRLVKDQRWVFCWAVDLGHKDTVKRLLTAGANPNTANTSHGPYWAPLHIAARRGNDEIIDLLLQHGANIHAISGGYCNCHFPTEISSMYHGLVAHSPIWYPLHTAICHGHESTARLLISRGASINVSPQTIGSDIRHVTALHSACYSGMLSITKFLVREGIQPEIDAEDCSGASPLAYAYYAGSWESVEFLAEEGASLNSNLGHLTILKHACRKGRFREALRLIELGVDINMSLKPSPHSFPMLHCCCMPDPTGSFEREQGQNLFRAKTIRTLIKAGADLEARWQSQDRESTTPLIEASRLNVEGAVEVLLAEGADVHAEDGTLECEDALSRACHPIVTPPEGATLRTVMTLLRYVSSDESFSALRHICQLEGEPRFRAEVEIFEPLIEHAQQGDWPPILTNGAGQYLFAKALLSRNQYICDILLKMGLREPNLSETQDMVNELIETLNDKGLRYILQFSQARRIMKAPLQILDAINRPSANCAAFLLEDEAVKAYLAEDIPHRIISACELVEDPILAALLLSNGADPNTTDEGGCYPLLYPVLGGNIPMVKLLLNHGATMHRHPTGIRGRGPVAGCLESAIYRGLKDVVKVMVDHASYHDATEKDRINYLLAACWEPESFCNGEILDILLSAGGLDLDAVYPVRPVTPLYGSLGRRNLKAIAWLVSNGANIHKCLHPAGSAEVPMIPNSVHSTPLEWAIDYAPVPFVEVMLNLPIKDKLTKQPKSLIKRYGRAARRRNDPEVIKLLLDAGLYSRRGKRSG
ncbi:ankyrin repeat-containing domain protein [Hypoxylon crocopeplum]|nr:ankyrin repeat-containing domain protein [Hypoxylon crocopeplum]